MTLKPELGKAMRESEAKRHAGKPFISRRQPLPISDLFSAREAVLRLAAHSIWANDPVPPAIEPKGYSKPYVHEDRLTFLGMDVINRARSQTADEAGLNSLATKFDAQDRKFKRGKETPVAWAYRIITDLLSRGKRAIVSEPLPEWSAKQNKDDGPHCFADFFIRFCSNGHLRGYVRSEDGRLSQIEPEALGTREIYDQIVRSGTVTVPIVQPTFDDGTPAELNGPVYFVVSEIEDAVHNLTRDMEDDDPRKTPNDGIEDFADEICEQLKLENGGPLTLNAWSEIIAKEWKDKTGRTITPRRVQARLRAKFDAFDKWQRAQPRASKH